jgi:DNA-binding winged helix-turn-helix (wHTH) protein
VPAQDSVRLVRFGEYELDLGSSELRKHDHRLPLPDQAIRILAMLERPGEVVTREQIIARLWPSGTVVEFDHGINSSIRRLRAALNDSAERSRYIETLPKRGYRFIFPVEGEAHAEATRQEEASASRSGRKWIWVGIGAARPLPGSAAIRSAIQ